MIVHYVNVGQGFAATMTLAAYHTILKKKMHTKKMSKTALLCINYCEEII